MKPPPHVGSWQFATIPEGWELVEDFGLRATPAGSSANNVSVVEEPIVAGKALQAYVEEQLVVVRHYLPEAEVIGPKPRQFPEVEEAQELILRYAAEGGQQVIQAQIYVRLYGHVGVLTCTTVPDELAHAQDAFDQIRKSARFHPVPPTKTSTPAG